MIYKDTKVWWYDGIGNRRNGTVERDVPNNEFMIPVKTESGNIINIAYNDLHIIQADHDN